MKPLATPVIGGMASSLLHVLLLTPVVFFWLRGRELSPGAGEVNETGIDEETKRGRA
jgi:Cu(I)/Ag(I) efflux system membrane protein CusA/SilA